MSSLVFYVQKRFDDGVRMGLEVNGVAVAERFDPGSGESDPALLWFVDLRCEGDLPRTYSGALEWLARYRSAVTDSYHGMAERLQVGLDADVLPATFRLSAPPSGVEIVVACSCVRRFPVGQMRVEVENLAGHWWEWLREMVPAEAQSR